MFEGSGSRGTADALAKFGVGKLVPFSELKPGDFVNLNRKSNSGHAVIFLGYLNAEFDIETEYSNKVKGFRYFSAQGKNSTDSGFGYRYAFFDDFCPTKVAGKQRDCTVRFSSDQAILNTGYMLEPAAWTIQHATEVYRERLIRERLEQDPFTPLPSPQEMPAMRARASAEVERFLSKELPPIQAQPFSKFDGATTDD